MSFLADVENGISAIEIVTDYFMSLADKLTGGIDNSKSLVNGSLFNVISDSMRSKDDNTLIYGFNQFHF